MEKTANQAMQEPTAFVKNTLTGLPFPQDFMEEARAFLARAEPDAYCFAAMDVLHFRLFNKLYGRDEGDRLLRKIADHLNAVCGEGGGAAGYFQGDDFCTVMPWRM